MLRSFRLLLAEIPCVYLCVPVQPGTLPPRKHSVSGNLGIIGKAAPNPQAVILDERFGDFSLCYGVTSQSFPQQRKMTAAAEISDNKMSFAQKEWPA
jgi:hypothetical protein